MVVSQFPERTTKEKGKSVLREVDVGNDKNSLPWVEKYRPTDLSELIAHQDIVTTINRFIDEDKLPHLLLYGPPGTGKTSLVLACARKLYGDNFRSMILELNASDDRGIDVVREQIKTFAGTKRLFSSGFKLIILDEADAMTQIAQNALRRVIEQYTANVRFCLICNYVGKIIPAVQSRCTKFRFAPLSGDQISARLNVIIANEQVDMTQDGREALMKLACGDMRRALNILQAVHTGYPQCNEQTVYACTGSPQPADMARVLNWLMTLDFSSALQNIVSLKQDKGLALADMLTELNALVNTIELPNASLIYLIDKLSLIEYNLAAGGNENIQLNATVAAFRIAVDLAAK